MSEHSTGPIARLIPPCRCDMLLSALFVAIVGCNNSSKQPPTNDREPNVQPSSIEKKIDPPNDLGFSKINFRRGDDYFEGIVDVQGNEVIQPSSKLLVNDITGNLALVQFERKFLFVPLDNGTLSLEDLASVEGFQYAEPYRCGLAMVSVNDARFYLDANFEKAFDLVFEFAESFHHDRALVKDEGRFRIIDLAGKTVSDLSYDQVNPQSPWCWQVTKSDGENYVSGFVDLDGKLITELVYDDVGYYDPAVERIWVSSNKRYGFLDEHAKVEIPVKYEYAEPFDRGKARVALNGRTFFINPVGMEVPE
jgi:hypothetical protein